MQYENPIIPHADIPQYAKALLQPVETRYKRVLFISWGIAYGVLLIALVCLFVFVRKFQLWWAIGLASLVFALLIAFTIAAIQIGFKNRAWALRDKDIIFKKGWLFQSTHIIPFIKIQHCVVRSGPIERKFGLASVRLMTAASGDIDISIHGLEATTAEQLKEWIMEKIAAHASPGV